MRIECLQHEKYFIISAAHVSWKKITASIIGQVGGGFLKKNVAEEEVKKIFLTHHYCNFITFLHGTLLQVLQHSVQCCLDRAAAATI